MNTLTYVGKLYNDNTFSFGYRPKERKLKAEKEYDRVYSSQVHEYYDQSTRVSRGDATRVVLYDFDIGRLRLDKGGKSSQSRTEEASKKPRNPYGEKGITSYGKKAVSCSARIIQDKFTKKRTGFGTATLPNLAPDAQVKAFENWGEIVRRYFQKLKRHWERKGQKLWYTSVTEVQEKRFRDTNVPYLHLHWVYNSKIGKQWTCTADDFRRYWRESVTEVVGNKCTKRGIPADWNGSIDCKPVGKSASAYIGKYMSKGVKVVKAMQEAGWNAFPKQWWSVSAIVRKAFKASIVSLSSDICSWLINDMYALEKEGLLHGCKEITIEMNGNPFIVGYCGRMNRELADLIRSTYVLNRNVA